MRDVFEWARAHVLGWTTGAAATLLMVRFVTPNFIDFVIDILSVGLVWVAAKLAKKA